MSEPPGNGAMGPSTRTGWQVCSLLISPRGRQYCGRLVAAFRWLKPTPQIVSDSDPTVLFLTTLRVSSTTQIDVSFNDTFRPT
jgi:hypothetical protein